MTSMLLNGWLRTYDPIHRGWTLAGIANGLCTTSGFSFPRVSSGYNLYRAVGCEPDASSELVGAAASDAATVQTFPWVQHTPDTQYYYRLVAVGGGGVENWTDRTMTTVYIDPAGNWQGLVPNAPSDLQVVPRAGGCLAVRWTYSPRGQQIEPAGFHLYRGEGMQVNYGIVDGTVRYEPGQFHFEFITLPEADSQRISWGVRAYAASGCEEESTHTAFAVARVAPPPANPAVIVEVVDCQR